MNDQFYFNVFLPGDVENIGALGLFYCARDGALWRIWNDDGYEVFASPEPISEDLARRIVRYGFVMAGFGPKGWTPQDTRHFRGAPRDFAAEPLGRTTSQEVAHCG